MTENNTKMLPKTMSAITLGCKVNHYETEAIWQLFKEAGSQAHAELAN